MPILAGEEIGDERLAIGLAIQHQIHGALSSMRKRRCGAV
jgi:hypothetical protein